MCGGRRGRDGEVRVVADFEVTFSETGLKGYCFGGGGWGWD